MKKIILSATFLLGVGTLSFAGSPKTDPPTETMYYFQISPDGSTFVNRTTNLTTPPCDGWSSVYCSVGLTIDQVDLTGTLATVKSSISTPPLTNRTTKD